MTPKQFVEHLAEIIVENNPVRVDLVTGFTYFADEPQELKRIKDEIKNI